MTTWSAACTAGTTGSDTGISSYDPSQRLYKFGHTVTGDGGIELDAAELAGFVRERALTGPTEVYDRLYADPHQASEEEPFVGEIHDLARNGLARAGHHGPVAAMGVPRTDLPKWDDLQLLTAQLARLPLLDDAPVATDVVIGPNVARPLRLDIPIFVSDMSFGALSPGGQDRARPRRGAGRNSDLLG